MKRDSSSPEAYRSTIDGDMLKIFDLIRALIYEVAPDVEERMDYGMPTYFLNGKNYVALAAQKHHVGLYAGIETLKACAEEIKGIDRGKSCLRFKRLSQIPEDTIRTVLTQAKEQCGDGC